MGFLIDYNSMENNLYDGNVLHSFKYLKINKKNYYFCQIDFSTISDDWQADINEEHEIDMTNDDVRGIFFVNCTISKIPKGMTAVFPNLEIIMIHGGNIKSLMKDDLAEYKNLTIFHCSHNKLSFLLGDLFEGFKNLERIVFVHNELLFIESSILDGLKKLKEVDFRDNPKYSCSFSDSEGSGSLDQLKDNLRETSDILVKNFDIKNISNENLGILIAKLKISDEKCEKFQKLNDELQEKIAKLEKEKKDIQEYYDKHLKEGSMVEEDIKDRNE